MKSDGVSIHCPLFFLVASRRFISAWGDSMSQSPTVRCENRSQFVSTAPEEIGPRFESCLYRTPVRRASHRITTQQSVVTMNTTLLVSCVVRRLYWKRMSHEEPRGAPPLHRVSFRPQSQTKHFNDSVYGIERQLSLPRQVTVQAGRVDLRRLGNRVRRPCVRPDSDPQLAVQIHTLIVRLYVPVSTVCQSVIYPSSSARAFPSSSASVLRRTLCCRTDNPRSASRAGPGCTDRTDIHVLRPVIAPDLQRLGLCL